MDFTDLSFDSVHTEIIKTCVNLLIEYIARIFLPSYFFTYKIIFCENGQYLLSWSHNIIIVWPQIWLLSVEKSSIGPIPISILESVQPYIILYDFSLKLGNNSSSTVGPQISIIQTEELAALLEYFIIIR